MTSERAPRTLWLRTALVAAATVIGLIAIVALPELQRDGSGGVDPVRAQSTDSPAPARSAVHVRVITVAPSPDDGAVHALTATGTLEARRHAPLSFAVSGVVARLDFDEGDSVSEGAPIARLDPVPFESAVSQASARVEYLEKSLARSERLLSQKALSDEEVDAQSAELAGARAQLRMAEWNLDRSVLRAPFDGVIEDRHVELGQVVGPQALAFEFVELDRLEVDAALPASDLELVDMQAPVRLVSSDDPRRVAMGTIDHAPVRSDARSGTVPLRVVVENSTRGLLPGTVVEVQFAPRDRGDEVAELKIPLSALRLDDDGQSVWVVRDGKVTKTPVELGPVRGDEVVVSAGLSAGDRIVDEAPDRLRSGDAVTTAATTGGSR